MAHRGEDGTSGVELSLAGGRAPLVGLLLQLCGSAGDLLSFPAAAAGLPFEQCAAWDRGLGVHVDVCTGWAVRGVAVRSPAAEANHCCGVVLVVRGDGVECVCRRLSGAGAATSSRWSGCSVL